MVGVPIATGRTPAELRTMARRERDGRVSGRLLVVDASVAMTRNGAPSPYLRATLRDLDVPTQTEAMRPGRTTVTFTKDPLLKMLAPSAKLGLVVYLH